MCNKTNHVLNFSYLHVLEHSMLTVYLPFNIMVPIICVPFLNYGILKKSLFTSIFTCTTEKNKIGGPILYNRIINTLNTTIYKTGKLQTGAPTLYNVLLHTLSFTSVSLIWIWSRWWEGNEQKAKYDYMLTLIVCKCNHSMRKLQL